MSKFNKDIMSDEELQQLLQYNLLQLDEDHPFNQEHTRMESQFVFGSALFNPGYVPGEQAFISKIGPAAKNLGYKWLFGSVVVAATGLGIYQYNNSQEPKLQIQPPISVIPAETLEDSIQSRPQDESPETDLFQQYAQPESNENHLNHELHSDATNQFSEATGPGIAEPFHAEMDRQNHKNILPHYGWVQTESNRLDFDTLFKGITHLEVEGGICSISVTKGQKGKTYMKTSISNEGKRKALEFALSYTVTGTTLKVRVEHVKKRFALNLASNNYTALMEFNVDPKTELSLKNTTGDMMVNGSTAEKSSFDCQYGNLSLENMESNLDIKSKSGNVSVKQVKGIVHCNSKFGDQYFEKIDGGLVTENNSGRVTLIEMKGNTAIKASFGDITLSDIKGELMVNEGSGNINITRVKAEKMNVVNHFGNIELSKIKANSTIEANSGEVVLNEVDGNISITGISGNQTLKNIKGDIKCVVNSGNVSIVDAIGALSIESTFGDISLNKHKGEIQLDSRSGNINGTAITVEKSMKLNCRYGNISMALLNPSEELSFVLDTPNGQSELQTGTVSIIKPSGQITHGNGQIIIQSTTQTGSQHFQ